MAVAVTPFESRIVGLARDRRELDALEGEWIFRVGDYVRSHEWQAEGFLSPAAALRNHCHMTHATASAAVRLAVRLEMLPETQKAFERGEISRQHAKVIADACTPERADEFAPAEQIFADAAKKLDTNDLRELVKRVTDALDGDGGAGDDKQQQDRNRFQVSPVGDRVRADGTVDREAGEIIITALKAMNAKMYPNGDVRDRSIRQAEALIEICRQSLHHDHKTTPRRRRGRPNMSAVVDVRAFEDSNPELVADIRAEVEHIGRLSSATLERIACDCEISRVITDGPSQIIDVGRKTKNIPDKLWRALVVRDGHCQEPGCDLAPGWCEAHHILYWTNGGPTNLNNLVLLCWKHHRKRHANDIKHRC